jgi:hypothetical protein
MEKIAEGTDQAGDIEAAQEEVHVVAVVGTGSKAEERSSE